MARGSKRQFRYHPPNWSLLLLPQQQITQQGVLEMKIAALYDIHGNLPALNAVLEELNEVQPDLILIGGDIVSGPMPLQNLLRHTYLIQ